MEKLSPGQRAVGEAGVSPTALTCVRCAELRAADPLSLIYFWDPRREPTPEDGEIVRAMALAEHAKYGHPTEADYR